MTYQTIAYETDERVAIITLNRPERLNAFSLELCREVCAAVARADADPDIRVLVVTGTGGKAFSAGYDLVDEEQGPLETVSEWNARLSKDFDFTMSVWNCSKPVIAMIDGYCLAGALEFAQMCDMRYCTEGSRFGVVETRFSAGIVTLIMPWIIGARCRELIYTGDIIDAQEALRLGLVNRVFAKDELRAQTLKIAKRISCAALDCLKWNKHALRKTHEAQGFSSAMAHGLQAATLMDATGTPETLEFTRISRTEGMQAALKWRREQFAAYE